MAFKMTGWSPFSKTIDNEGIKKVAEENNISVSMVNSIIKEIGDEPGVDPDVYSIEEVNNAVKDFLKDRGDENPPPPY
tara:strand:+ start:1402 stop:1635 length:234 start_codon:yes stop_codon:yes gene_type:complete